MMWAHHEFTFANNVVTLVSQADGKLIYGAVLCVDHSYITLHAHIKCETGTCKIHRQVLK